jgi:hypothetical protein
MELSATKCSKFDNKDPLSRIIKFVKLLIRSRSPYQDTYSYSLK